MYHYMLLGKRTTIATTREKECNMSARLNDKNLQQLQDAEQVDGDLGMATPGNVGVQAQANQASVKSEFPTLPLLTEAIKNAKNTYQKNTHTKQTHNIVDPIF